jgi:hypothetical protein
MFLLHCYSSSRPWPQYVRKPFDLGRSRADELIQIADGRTTVAETRAATAQRVQKHAKSPLANGGSVVVATKPKPTSVTESINDRVGELGEFLFPWCNDLERWVTKSTPDDAICYSSSSGRPYRDNSHSP